MTTRAISQGPRRATPQGPRCYSYIRFSTPEQKKGDSLRRQIKLSADYAKERGLVLDDSLTPDEGISAFKGEHRKRGALGKFRALVEAGHIPRGSTLLVESLDRLSREEPEHAYDELREIVKGGVSVVTLQDGKEYVKGRFNAGDMIRYITIMERAHEESLTKSKRLSSAWAEKRQLILKEGKPLTAKRPNWLRFNKDKKAFIEIPERADVVRKIFAMALEGVGGESIAKALNAEKTPAWTPKNGWRKSYITKILHNRAVMGEFQPHSGRGTSRTPAGEAIQNYYQTVVDENTFFRVQVMRQRNAQFGGRNGTISNLFGGLAKCGHCEGPMRFIDKGKPPKGGRYLVCDNAARGVICERHPWRYDEIEELILTYVGGLNVSDLLNTDQKEKSRLTILNGELAAVSGKLGDTGKKIANLEDAVTLAQGRPSQESLLKKLDALHSEKDSLTKERKELERGIAALSSKSESVEEQLESVKQLIAFMRREKGEKPIEVRRRLRSRLRDLVEAIRVDPIGADLAAPWLRKLPTEERRKYRSLTVYLKSGDYKVLQPQHEPQLTQLYDREKDATYFPFINPYTGKPDMDVVLDEDKEAERQKTEDRVNKKMRKRARERRTRK